LVSGKPGKLGLAAVACNKRCPVLAPIIPIPTAQLLIFQRDQGSKCQAFSYPRGCQISVTCDF
jgi:hypothetical protein